jgi:phosphoadenosine phosphosulfate reductase
MKIYSPPHSIKLHYQQAGIPEFGMDAHSQFTESVKIRPFRQALRDQQPDIWFTNIRKGQTSHRDSLDILSMSKEGILKVSPFFYWTSKEVHEYLKWHQLPNEFRYYDPTKVFENRECGIHHV